MRVEDLTFATDAGCVTPHQCTGFFVGWPLPPSPEQLVAVLDGSYRRVVGFINAISDGVLTAFIPWLEVLPDYQGHGLGRELVRRLLEELGGMYSIDLCCDPELVPYYEKQGFLSLSGAGLRNPGAIVAGRG